MSAQGRPKREFAAKREARSVIQSAQRRPKRDSAVKREARSVVQ